MANHYDIPGWAGKPTTGLHLDVTKDGKLIQKLMIDQKKCYLFGRNPQMCDFSIDHASCSRVHAALVWHKHLSRAFLVDLGSTHGTFIGTMRIESEKPTQLPIDSTFHFGASSRYYILRERPQTAPRSILEELEEEAKTEHQDGGLLGLPESEMELDNLTEFNTAHNRRISMLGIADEDLSRNSSGKRKKRSITFNDEEEVINPEDVDPSVGRFRNLVQTSMVIPSKRIRNESIPSGTLSSLSSSGENHFHRSISTASSQGLYGGLPPEMGGSTSSQQTSSGLFSATLASKLGFPLLPNPAPDVDLSAPIHEPAEALPQRVEFAQPPPPSSDAPSSSEPKRKKYAKEHWPGKKPAPSLLI